MWQLAYQLLATLRRCYWFIFRPNTKGVKVLIEYNGAYLFIRHGYGSAVWTLPGGGIQFNESSEDAVRRETKEEVHLDLGVLVPLGSFQNTWEYKKDVVECFYSRLEAPQDVKLHHGEVIAYQWFPKSSLPDDIAMSALKVIEFKLSFT